MKKIMILALSLCMGLGNLYAQESSQQARKTVFAKDKSTNHWFVELGDAATVNFGGNNSQAKFGDRVSFFNPTLSVGKWHNPYFATRLQLMGGQMYDFAVPQNSKVLSLSKYNYALGHVDFMLDLVNFFSPYRESKIFHVIPYVGVGYAGNWKRTTKGAPACATSKDYHYTPVVDAGVQFKFRLSKVLDLNIEAQALASDLRLLSQSNGGVTGAVMAGLGFNIGKKEFTPIVEEDTELLRSLNDQLNALRAENAELSKRPESCPEVAPQPLKGVAVGNVVYFRLNSDKIDANQLINIFNIAEYAKNNTEVITLVGYADKQTGTPSYNYDLSERRAKAVAKVLVEKYGISADRIRTSWEGDKVQPYNLNEWNRVVIMSAAE